jgi:hypothetical protein
MNRRTIGLIVGIAVLSGFCGGATSVGLLLLRPDIASRLTISTAATKSKSAADIVTAHGFVLIDNQGRTLATFRGWDDGSAGLVFASPRFTGRKSEGYGLGSRAAAGIVVFATQPELHVGNEATFFLNGTEADGLTGGVLLSTTSGSDGNSGSSSLTVARRSGPIVEMSADDPYPNVTAEGSASVELSHERCGSWLEEKDWTPTFASPRRSGCFSGLAPPYRYKRVKYARLDDDGLEVRNKRGTVTLSPDALSLSDSYSDPRLSELDRAVLGITQLETKGTGEQEMTAPSSLTLFDKKGNVIWRAP